MSQSGDPTGAEKRAERRVGTTVHGKYTIERVLGVGGMATVYLAVHRNGHRVALKMLHAEVAADSDMRARFVREGYAANAIDHPGVVRVLDDDETDDGAAFLVMELLDGETLQTRARRSGGRLLEREVLALAHQLLGALAAAHARGILHRDVKPENLFLTKTGALKVLDFGIARIEGGLSGSEPTRTGRAMGTPAFMSPEQAFGKAREIDARSDLWSAGATMFMLLSGKHVHEAENAAEMLVYAATKPARSLGSVGADVSAQTVALVDRALAFEKKDRWASATEMQGAVAEAYAELYGSDVGSALATSTLSARSALEAAETIDVSTPPIGTPTPAPKGKRFVAAVFALVAAVALGGIAMFAQRDARTGASAPSAASSASASAAECATNAACGARRICRAGKCAALESEDCRVLARNEDVTNDATIWIGAMFATEGPMAPEFAASINGVDLARRDFAEITNGVPPAKSGGPTRPIGVVLCNDGNDPERAARHLVDDLGVPAILGFSRSKEVADLTVSMFNPRGVLALAANTATMLSSLPVAPGQPRLVWRTTTGATVEAPAIAALSRDVLEPRARARLAKDEPLRVALVCYDNASGLGVSDAIVSQLRYNGKSVAENGQGFRQFAMPPSEDREKVEIERRAPEIAAFKPHLVIDMTNGLFSVGAIERAFGGEPRRPTYVLGSSLAAPSVLERVRATPELRTRLFGVETISSTSAVAKFVLRYNEIFSPKVTALSATGAPYDSFYLLAYAITALGDQPITGANLARALRRLMPPGAPIDVGPASIYKAYEVLGRGENIDLAGTVTSLDFDAATGDPTIDLAVYCVKADRGDVQAIESGLFWRGRDRRLAGEMKCP